jgi:hypothetical protein
VVRRVEQLLDWRAQGHDQRQQLGDADVPPPALHLRDRDPPPRMPEFIEARSYVLLV